MDAPLPLTSEQLLKINDQMNKCVCQILLSEGKGTGFFVSIPNKSTNIQALITANHVINEDYLSKESTINLLLDNGKEMKKIAIGKNRKVFTNRKYDITIIEIIESKDNIYNFLEIDNNIFNNISIFEKSSVYLLFYSKDNYSRVSFGTIKKIEDSTNRIIHNCFSDFGSTGGPILSSSHSKVIGIHIGKMMNRDINLKRGSFLNQVISEFLQNFNYS